MQTVCIVILVVVFSVGVVVAVDLVVDPLSNKNILLDITNCKFIIPCIVVYNDNKNVQFNSVASFDTSVVTHYSVFHRKKQLKLNK